MRFYPLTFAGRIRHISRFLFHYPYLLYSARPFNVLVANIADPDQTALIRRHNVCLHMIKLAIDVRTSFRKRNRKLWCERSEQENKNPDYLKLKKNQQQKL